MIIFTYNKQRHNLINEWSDMTLTQAIDISAVKVPDVPDWFDWFQHLDLVDLLLEKFSTFKEWSLINPAEKVNLFITYVLPLVQDLHAETPKTYVPRMITGFTHNGTDYLMPTNLDIGTETILQHGQTAKPFIEASNLLKMFSEMKGEGIKVMPHFIACVVKIHPEEQFDEKEIARRVEEFKTLPMDLFWEVFFCTLQHIYRLQLSTLRSMIKVKEPEPRGVVNRLASRLGRLRSRRAELLDQLKQ